VIPFRLSANSNRDRKVPLEERREFTSLNRFRFTISNIHRSRLARVAIETIREIEASRTAILVAEPVLSARCAPLLPSPSTDESCASAH